MSIFPQACGKYLPVRIVVTLSFSKEVLQYRSVSSIALIHEPVYLSNVFIKSPGQLFVLTAKQDIGSVIDYFTDKKRIDETKKQASESASSIKDFLKDLPLSMRNGIIGLFFFLHSFREGGC